MRFGLALLILAGSLYAHEIRPGYLELKEAGDDTWSVVFKVPGRGPDKRLGLYLRLPQDCKPVGSPRIEYVRAAFIERTTIRRAGGLTGAEIYVEGLSSTLTDVLVRVERAEGNTQVVRLTPDAPSFVVEAAPTWFQVARTYFDLGFEHILLGIDHLLFVLALLLTVKGWRRVVATITAFTIAHSLTLAAASLGLVHVPQPPVEAIIALSIVFVVVEHLRADPAASGLTQRRPWTIAFCFGLLHGLGFAGALTEIGLPQNAIPLALLFFNVGVEAGQLLFVATVLALLALVKKLRVVPAPVAFGSRVVAAYAIGCCAVFWLVERVIAF